MEFLCKYIMPMLSTVQSRISCRYHIAITLTVFCLLNDTSANLALPECFKFIGGCSLLMSCTLFTYHDEGKVCKVNSSLAWCSAGMENNPMLHVQFKYFW